MLEELNASLNLIVTQTKANAPILAKILLIPWVAYFLNLCMNKQLLYLGIYPRHLCGLAGIVMCPLLHVNFNHLFFNSIPLIVLSNFILINGVSYYIHVTVIIVLLSGLLVWCFGKKGIHVGASSLITGYWGLLVSHVFQQATVTAIILGIITLYYFAGIFLGIFTSQKGVSWEGHFFGLMAGLTVSYIGL